MCDYLYTYMSVYYIFACGKHAILAMTKEI